MYTDYSGYLPAWAKVSISIAVGAAAILLFPAAVTIGIAVIIAGVTYSALDCIDEFAKAKKLEKELENELSLIENEQIRETYRSSAENAIGFRRGYAGYGATRPSFYRAMSSAEAQAVQDTGYLRGGREGQTFFTNTPYYSSRTAQSQLSLPTSPDYMVQFRISNNPSIFGPQMVGSMYGYNGGGVEYYTYDAVRVVIESIWKLN